MIIIPVKWLFHWEYTLFSDIPLFDGWVPSVQSLLAKSSLNPPCLTWDLHVVAPRTENLRRRGALHASLFGLGQSPQMLPVGGLLLAPRHLVITTDKSTICASWVRRWYMVSGHSSKGILTTLWKWIDHHSPKLVYQLSIVAHSSPEIERLFQEGEGDPPSTRCPTILSEGCYDR